MRLGMDNDLNILQNKVDFLWKLHVGVGIVLIMAGVYYITKK
jgi:hypothetical protein